MRRRKAGRAITPGAHPSYVLGVEAPSAEQWLAALAAHIAFATAAAEAEAERQLRQGAQSIERLLGF